MSIYDINYNYTAVQLLPPDKRMPSFVKWLQALLCPLQYNVSSLFNDYKLGSSYPIYVAASYNKFDRVIYGQSVYESLVNDNTAEPTDTNYWRIYQNYFTGVDTRIMYNSQTLVFEYALNTRFGATFRQPPAQSDIYITTNTPPSRVFQVGADESLSSTVRLNGSSEFVVDSYSYTPFRNLVINIPIAVYDGLSIDVAAREKIVRFFADKYIIAGIIYKIQTY